MPAPWSSLWRKLFRLVAWITVEPVEFFYVLTFTTSKVVRDNLFMEKVCILDMKQPEELCYNLTHVGGVPDSVKESVQQRVTDLELWDGIMVALPSVFFCLFLGAWSDYHGRKLLLIAPFIGNILSYVAYILNYYFFNELNTNHLLWGSLVGFCGGYQALNMGLYGYVSDVTSLQDRTMRLSVLNGVFSTGYVIGTMLGGALYEAGQSFYVIFGLSIGFGLLGIAYTLAFVRESVSPPSADTPRPRLIDWRNVVQCLATAFKARPNLGRMHILVLLVNFNVFMFCLNTFHYDYLLVGIKYDWTIIEYSTYLTIQRVFRLLGLFLLLPLLSRVLKINDNLISIVGTLITTVAYLLIAIGDASWTGPTGSWPIGWPMYLSAALQFNSVLTVIIRSQCTKCVEPDENGRIFAVVAFGQALVPLVANPIFGLIYKATLSTYPGTYVFVVCALLLLAATGSIWLYFVSLKQRPITHAEDQDRVKVVGGNSRQ